MGVFSRSELVYTVYIPMNDVGSGPDCPMQYALFGSSAAPVGSLGLLTPPMVVKKVPATAPKADIGADAGPVFLTGIIDKGGNLQLLRTARAMDARAQVALRAVAQWEFLAAQLDGKPVETLMDLRELLDDKAIGRRVNLSVLRGEKLTELTVTPTEAEE